MNSENFAVVFDTNSYRNLIRDTSIEDIKANIAQLKEREASKNIMALATPVVGMELLANLAGPGKGLHYDDCLKALIAMANHCYEKTEEQFRVVPDPYLHITQNFFDVTVPAVELISKNIIGVIGDFKDDYLKAVEGHHFSDTFKVLKNYIDREEPRWITEVENHVEEVRRKVLELDPSIDRQKLRKKMLEFIDSGRFVPMISMAIIFAIAQSLEIKMTGEEHSFKGFMLPRTFPLSVGFYQWICHRVVADNINLKSKISRQKRWNWRWDYEVSFLMNDLPLSRRIVLLVTSDRDMTKMLENYGYGERVMNLEKYLEFLNT